MNKQLSGVAAAMLIAGAGIGTGILTLPYAMQYIGLTGTLAALAAAVFVSRLLYCMIADLTLRSKNGSELTGILNEHLFDHGRQRIRFRLFSVLLVIVLIENLIVYILCAAQVISGLTGLNEPVSRLLFYAAASFVMLFGIRGIGLGEKISVGGMTCVIVLLIVLSCLHPKAPLSLSVGAPEKVLAVYGLFMFSFSAIFAVIQATNYLDKKEHLKRVLEGGLFLNALLTLLFCIAALIGSEHVTSVATNGLTQSLGLPFLQYVCAALILLAMLTSFWSGAMMFGDVIDAQLHTGRALSWGIVTVPTLLAALFLPLSVLDYIQVGAGALSVMILLALLPAYKNAVNSDARPTLLKNGTKKSLLVFTAAATVVMALSSLIPVD